jgi:hypothetical protein
MRHTHAIALGICIAVVVLMPAAGFSQDTPVKKVSVDLAVPESPGFTVLGLNPETVTRPSSPQQFATALLSGVDKNGNFQSGIAIDTQPYLLWSGESITWARYRDHWSVRFLSRAQFSLATAKGATDEDKSARIGMGARFTVFDLGDPYRNEVVGQCLVDAHTKALAGVPIPGPAATQQEIDAHNNALLERLEPLETACRDIQADRERLREWNNSSLIVGLAGSWISESGNTGDLDGNGSGYWVSAAYGFENVPGLEDASQLIFHYRHRNKEQVPDPASEGKFLTQDSDVAGFRWRLGTANTTGSFEYLFFHESVVGGAKDTSTQFSLGLERRISGNTWLSLSFGGKNGRADGANQGFVLSSLNWSFTSKD